MDGIFAFIFAVLASYSRIYLAEDVLQDVAAGAAIGVFFGILSYYLLFQKENSFFRRYTFNDKAGIAHR